MPALPKVALLARPPRPIGIGNNSKASSTPSPRGARPRSSGRNSTSPIADTDMITPPRPRSDSSIDASPSQKALGRDPPKLSLKSIQEAQAKEKRRRKALRPAVSSLFKAIRSVSVEVDEADAEIMDECACDDDGNDPIDSDANDMEADTVEADVQKCDDIVTDSNVIVGDASDAAKTPVGLDAGQVAEVFSRLGCSCTDSEVELFLVAYGQGNGRIRVDEFMSYVLGWWHFDDIAYVAWSEPPTDLEHSEQLFEDADFPPLEDVMLGDGCPGRVKNRSVAFPRCSEIIGQGRQMTLFRDVHSFELQYICQGILLNCWLMAAIACVAEFPGQIQSLFRTKSVSSIGRYEVQLYDAVTRKWRVIELDDRLPCTDYGDASEGQQYHPLFSKLWCGELWLPLLEKAVAKHVGNYGELMRGNAGFAFQLLTGCDPNNIWAFGKLEVKGRRDSEVQGNVGSSSSSTASENLGSRSSTRGSKLSKLLPPSARVSLSSTTPGGAEDIASTAADLVKWDHKIVKFPDRSPHGREERRGNLGTIGSDQLWQKLCLWKKKHYLITAATSGKSEAIGSEGLIRGHCYSIFSVVEATADGEEHRMVQLRNPWRRTVEWRGRFSNTWEDWNLNPELQAVLLPYQKKSMFWMSFEDFAVFFATLIVCTLPMISSPTNRSIVLRCRRPPNMLQNPAKTFQSFVTLFADFDIEGKKRVGPRALLALLRSLAAYIETDATHECLARADAALETARANSEKFDFPSVLFWIRSILCCHGLETVGTAGKWQIVERQAASADRMASRERSFDIEIEVELGQISGTTIGLQRNLDIVGQKAGLEASFALVNKAGIIEKTYKCKFADSLHAYAEGTWSTEEGAFKSGSFSMTTLRPKPLDLKKLVASKSAEFTAMSVPAATHAHKAVDIDLSLLGRRGHEGLQEPLRVECVREPLHVISADSDETPRHKLLDRIGKFDQALATPELGTIPEKAGEIDTSSYDACVNRLDRFLQVLESSDIEKS